MIQISHSYSVLPYHVLHDCILLQDIVLTHTEYETMEEATAQTPQVNTLCAELHVLLYSSSIIIIFIISSGCLLNIKLDVISM